MVQPGVNGELVAPGDPAAWSAQLTSIFQDPTLVRRWREQASLPRQAASPHVLTQKVLDVFARTAAHAGAPVARQVETMAPLG